MTVAYHLKEVGLVVAPKGQCFKDRLSAQYDTSKNFLTKLSNREKAVSGCGSLK